MSAGQAAEAGAILDACREVEDQMFALERHRMDAHLEQLGLLTDARRSAIASIEIDADLLQLQPDHILHELYKLLEMVARERGDMKNVQLICCPLAHSTVMRAALEHARGMVQIESDPTGGPLIQFAGVPVRRDGALASVDRSRCRIMACPIKVERRAEAIRYVTAPPLQAPKVVEKVVEREVLVEIDEESRLELERRRRDDERIDRELRAIGLHLHAAFNTALTVGAIAYILYLCGAFE